MYLQNLRLSVYKLRLHSIRIALISCWLFDVNIVVTRVLTRVWCEALGTVGRCFSNVQLLYEWLRNPPSSSCSCLKKHFKRISFISSLNKVQRSCKSDLLLQYSCSNRANYCEILVATILFQHFHPHWWNHDNSCYVTSLLRVIIDFNRI